MGSVELETIEVILIFKNEYFNILIIVIFMIFITSVMFAKPIRVRRVDGKICNVMRMYKFFFFFFS